MEKKEALYYLIKITECDGKKQGAWSSLDGVNEEITDRFEEHILDIADECGFEIPPMEDFTQYEEDYRNREERATEVLWTMQDKFKNILLDL